MYSVRERLDRYFGISSSGSSFGTEVRAGLITFLAMSYILIVNPNIMSDAGMDWGAAFTSTAVSAMIGTAVMALYARFPVALAPGMGINAFFTYTVVISLGYTWEQALAAVFISGVAFFLISVSGLRTKMMDAIPLDLRYATIAGIGMFIAFVGLNNSGLIVGDASTLVRLGDISSPLSVLAIFGIMVTLMLHFLKVKGAILIGIIVTAGAGVLFGAIDPPSSVSSVPVMPDLGSVFTGLTTVEWGMPFLMVIFSFFMVDFFDSAGTLFAVGDKANMMDEDGNLKNAGKAFTADAGATVVGAVLGAPPVTSYAESVTGIDSGGRTGFMALVVAGLFAVALFMSPLFSVVTAQCTVAALLLVGASMIMNLMKINWKDTVVAVSSFLTVIMMTLTYSITNGIAFGFIVYCFGMIVTRRTKEIGIFVPLMAGLFIIYFVMTVYAF